jgi:ornithine carbamoyltransferase
LKGLKLAFVGDGNNVCNSLLMAASKVGMDMSVTGPQGYEPQAEVMAEARRFAAVSGSRILFTSDPVEDKHGSRGRIRDAPSVVCCISGQ